MAKELIGIIPAAGKGTRFGELGALYSKTILPYRNKPIIVHSIEWMRNHGVGDIYVIVNHNADVVAEFLDIYELDRVHLINKPSDGPGRSIKIGIEHHMQKTTADFDALIVLGDIVPERTPVFLAPGTWREHASEHCVTISVVSDYERWCMVETDMLVKQNSDPMSPVNMHVTKIIDKPTTKPKTLFALNGIYLVRNAANLSCVIPPLNSGEFQISVLLNALLIKGETISTFNSDVKEFGTYEEFLRNRQVSISRSFNDIVIDDDVVTKHSSKVEKLFREYSWLRTVGEGMNNVPRVWEYMISGSYTMDRIYAPTLKELFVFLSKDEQLWNRIFQSAFSVLSRMKNNAAEVTKCEDFFRTIHEKNKSRLAEISHRDAEDEEFIHRTLPRVLYKYESDDACLMHGDFCFSNLLFDDRSNKIIMIDPRGEIYGHSIYDLAKLYHSVFGLYEIIDAEMYVVNNDYTMMFRANIENIQRIFIDYLDAFCSRTGIDQEHVHLLTASLFLTMIPLHSHNAKNQEMYYDTYKHLLRTSYKEFKEHVQKS